VRYILRFRPETDFDPDVCDFEKTNSSGRVGSETIERLPSEQVLRPYPPDHSRLFQGTAGLQGEDRGEE
jgi:hypothetical protein